MTLEEQNALNAAAQTGGEQLAVLSVVFLLWLGATTGLIVWGIKRQRTKRKKYDWQR